jgi:putative oxidoreductase
MIAFMLSLHAYADWGVLAVRVAMAATFIAHGLMKQKFWKMQPNEQMPAGMISLMRLLSICEPLGGLAVLVGFLTPLAALGLGIIMAGAIYNKATKWHVPFASTEKLGWEFDTVLLAIALLLIFVGPGSLSLDRMFFGW